MKYQLDKIKPLISLFYFYLLFTLFMISVVPFCFENILKLREKVRENLVCSLMWGVFWK